MGTIAIYYSVIAVIGFGFASLGVLLLALRRGQQLSEAQQGPRSFLVSLRMIAPGYWFALFGAVIVVLCFVRGLWINPDAVSAASRDVAAADARANLPQSAGSAISGASMLVVTIALMIVTAWYAWSTHRYVALVQREVQSQHDPYVVAYTRRAHDKNGIDIVVENLGRGVAKNVRFERSAKTKEELWDEFLRELDSRTPSSANAIKTGISVLRPGMEVLTFWDAKSFNLAGGLHVVCKCERLGPGPKAEVDPLECLLHPTPVPADRATD
jgi:hypothetical protein